MFQQVVVPIDGSASSWKAVPVAARLAAAVDGKLEIVTVVDRVGAVGAAEADLDAGLDRLAPLPVPVRAEVIAGDSIVDVLAEFIESRVGAMVVMSSHGHGRSAAVLGSVADELLQLTFGPIIVVGPHVADDAGVVDGRLIVPLDGSDHGEKILPIVSAWVVEFDAEPWLVEVVEPMLARSTDYLESAYPARWAAKLTAETGHEFEFDVLHDENPATAVAGFADRSGASLILASTHGRSGLDRLRIGSVAAGMVKHATCPVMLYRPPHLDR
jgi:nucleotide-binding universal stress UspA family protein